jgi:hypothetical protein
MHRSLRSLLVTRYAYDVSGNAMHRCLRWLPYAVAKAIRRMNSSSKASKENSRRYHQQQEFLEKITDLEQATAGLGGWRTVGT